MDEECNKIAKFVFSASSFEASLDQSNPFPPGWKEAFKKECERREIDSIPGLGLLLELKRRQAEAIERIRNGDVEAEKEYANLECWRMRFSHEYKEAMAWIKKRETENQEKESSGAPKRTPRRRR